MSEDPAPYGGSPDPEALELADLLRDAIVELRGVEDWLERAPITPEQGRALAAVRAALAELRTVVPPDDWPR